MRTHIVEMLGWSSAVMRQEGYLSDTAGAEGVPKVNNLAAWAPTLTTLTPRRAKMLVAQLSPALCRALERWARETLVKCQRQGESDAARLCIVVLDALRSAEAAQCHPYDGLPPLAA